MLISAACLVFVGMATLYAIGHPADPSQTAQDADQANLMQKQLLFFAMGLAGFGLINFFNYRRLGYISYWLYGLILFLLFLLLVSRYVTPLPFIPQINGTHRWIVIQFGGLRLPNIQPSEFCKLIYIIALAWYLRYRSNYRSISSLLGPFVLTLVPMGLILLEPDLGTFLLMMPVLFSMLFVAGAKRRHLVVIILLAIMVSPLFWTQMRAYQRRRISSVLLQNQRMQDLAEKHPELGRILVGTPFSRKRWVNDWGYHLLRSKYAVSSGGIEGRGYRQGPFIRYNFLPERENDFIFAMIAHQFGFIGAVAVMGLYAVLIFCGLEIAVNNTDPFARLLAVGISAMFAVEVVINISMTLGLMPITGLTLPFVSKGGSSLLVSMLALGLLNNIGRSRPFSTAPKPFDTQ